MKKYIKSITEMNSLTVDYKNIQEIERYAESDIFWAKNKTKELIKRSIKKGDIYQFEFGKNFISEMSYEHRGLVIGTSGQLLYALPICSYNANIKEHRDACSLDNLSSKSNYFLLKEAEFDFLKHDSVLKLNDIRTVSTGRIKYKQRNGYISVDSITYKQIEKMVLAKYFYNFAYDYKRLIHENELLKEENSNLEKANKKLLGKDEK